MNTNNINHNPYNQPHSHVIKPILLLLCLFSLSKSLPCNLGCLSCNTSTGHCNLCDMQSFYYLDPSTQLCVRKKPQNCFLSFSLGKCLICENNTAPTPEHQCKELGSQAILNCKLYFAGGLCAKCDKNYFVSGDGRKCLNSKLANSGNCEVFGERTCLKCDDGYLFDSITLACTAHSHSKHCLSENEKLNCHSGKCSAASQISLKQHLKNAKLSDPKSNTILRLISIANKNLYFPSPFLNYYLSLEKNYLASSSSEKIYNDPNFMQIQFGPNLNTQNPFDSAQAGVTQMMFPFCHEVDANNKCVKCVHGYSNNFLDGVCHKKLNLTHRNCALLSASGNCQVCKRGFYLSNGLCIGSKDFESNGQNAQVLNQFQQKVDRMYVKKMIRNIPLSPEFVGKPGESREIIVSPQGGNVGPNTNSNGNQINANSNSTVDNTDSSKNVQIDTDSGSNQNTTNPSTDQTNNNNNQSNVNSINKYLSLKSQKPEDPIMIESLTLLNSSSNQILFPNNRQYLLERNYEVLSASGQSIETRTIDYRVHYENGKVLMAYDMNADKSTGPQIELNEQDLAKNCSKLILKGSEDHALPVCIECINFGKYYLRNYSEYETEAKVCVRRTRLLTNCRQYDPNSEFCEVCQPNYFLYTDVEQQICFEEIPFCDSHKVVVPDIICERCSEGYVFQGKACVPQVRVNNCRQIDGNHCLVCEDGFLLYNNNCINQMSFSFFGCPLNETGECLCGSSALEVKKMDQCVKVRQDNCQLYIDGDTCAKCKEGYYLNTSRICLEGEIPFCKEYGDLLNGLQMCKGCLDGYVLENNTCREVINLFSNHCVEQKGENCLKCSNSAYRLDFSQTPKNTLPSSLQICTQNVFFNAYENSRNCVSFDLESRTCLLCAEGFWVQEQGNCGPCDLTTSAIDNTNTKCITPVQLVPGCELYDKDFCVKCKNSRRPKILNEENFTELIRTYSNRQLNQFEEQPHFVINECETELSPQCSTEFCENAVLLDDGQKCCKKCQFSRSGAWVKQNDIYYTPSCAEMIDFCDGSVKFKGMPLEFEIYLTCHHCVENRMVNLNLTEGMIQTSCVQHSVNRPDLANCQILYENNCNICKPMARRILDQDNNLIECQEIPNCLSSNTVEKCEVCATGFSVDSSGENCVPAPIKNCQIINEQFQCIQCLDGLFLYENACFQTPNPMCLEYRGKDCVSCNPDNSLDQSGQNLNLLVNISFQYQNPFSYTEKALCISPSSSPNNPIIPNCMHYDSFNICLECQSPYILKESPGTRICVENPNITQSCKRLDQNGNCIQCEDGMYLEGDRCLEGQIQGCLEYVDQMNCGGCREKFVLLEKGRRRLCFYDFKVEQCAKTLTVQSESSGVVQINCLECEPNFRRNSFGFASPVCYPLRFVQNCKKVDMETNFCDVCDDLYFLDFTRKCAKRQNFSIKFCKQLDPQSDSCLECLEGHVLSPDKMECTIRKINAITGCKIQHQEGEGCLVCDDMHFLNKRDGTCARVNVNIENCMVFASESACMMCKIGFVLVQSPLGQICQIDTRTSYSNFKIFATSKKIDQVMPAAVTSSKKKVQMAGMPQEVNQSPQMEIQINKKTNQVVRNPSILNSLNSLATPKSEGHTHNPQFGFDEDEFSQPRILQTYDNNNKEIQTPEYFETNSKSFFNRILQSNKTVHLSRVCGLCMQGYSFSQKESKCVKSSIAGCMVSSSSGCKICQAQSFQNENGDCISNYQSGINEYVFMYQVFGTLLWVLLFVHIV